MSRRNRLNHRMASPPPATPQGDDNWQHPAYQPDPDKDKYQNGDTSSWAEDVHRGPYDGSVESPAPATPVGNDAWSHPAAKQAHMMEQIRIRKASNAKALKCVKIAQFYLGDLASENRIKKEALGMMDLSNEQVDLAYNDIQGNRFAACDDMMEDDMMEYMEDDMMGHDFMDDDMMDGLDMMEDEMMSDLDMMGDEMMWGGNGPGMADVYASDDDVDMMLDELYEEDDVLLPGDDLGLEDDLDLVDPEYDDFSEMLAGQNAPDHFYMGDKKKTASLSKEAYAQLQAMLEEQAEMARYAADEDDDDDEEEEVEAEDAADDAEEEEEEMGKEAMMTIEASLSEPLDMMAEFELSETDRNVLASLYEDQFFGKEDREVLAAAYGQDVMKLAGDDEEEEVEVEEEENMGKEASVRLRPTARKQSNGARQLGNMVRSASAGPEDQIRKLQALWGETPDVSNAFK